jgi:DNA-binding transcriptional ArsR family regulator
MPEMTLSKQARLLRTLSHPGRLAILATLSKGEACVCHLAAALGRSQPYVSQQLAVLRAAGLISSRRQGTFTYYALRDFAVLGIVDLADRLVGSPVQTHARPTVLPECGCPACRLAPAEEQHAR